MKPTTTSGTQHALELLITHLMAKEQGADPYAERMRGNEAIGAVRLALGNRRCAQLLEKAKARGLEQ